MKSLFSLFFCLLFVSQTISNQNDYDFEESSESSDYDNSDECNDESNGFIDRLMKIHENNRSGNKSDDKFDIEANTRYVLDHLFQYKINKIKFVELFASSNKEQGISKRCSDAFSIVIKALERTELWAIKCKSRFLFTHECVWGTAGNTLSKIMAALNLKAEEPLKNLKTNLL